MKPITDRYKSKASILHIFWQTLDELVVESIGGGARPSKIDTVAPTSMADIELVWEDKT